METPVCACNDLNSVKSTYEAFVKNFAKSTVAVTLNKRLKQMKNIPPKEKQVDTDFVTSPQYKSNSSTLQFEDFRIRIYCGPS